MRTLVNLFVCALLFPGCASSPSFQAILSEGKALIDAEPPQALERLRAAVDAAGTSSERAVARALSIKAEIAAGQLRQVHMNSRLAMTNDPLFRDRFQPGLEVRPPAG